MGDGGRDYYWSGAKIRGIRQAETSDVRLLIRELFRHPAPHSQVWISQSSRLFCDARTYERYSALGFHFTCFLYSGLLPVAEGDHSIKKQATFSGGAASLGYLSHMLSTTTPMDNTRPLDSLSETAPLVQTFDAGTTTRPRSQERLVPKSSH